MIIPTQVCSPLRYRAALVTACGLLMAATAWAGTTHLQEQSIDVSGNAAETQSVVLPPWTKGCSDGRILTSVDKVRPNGNAAPVVSRSLKYANTGASPQEQAGIETASAVFTGEPFGGFTDYLFATNDHDLIRGPGGDVFYLMGAFSKVVPTTGKPAWFNSTRRPMTTGAAWGPGARSVVLVWRSTDCGQSFFFESQLDPAEIGDGSCANPQGIQTDFILGPQHQYHAYSYDNAGGTDGQLAYYSEKDQALYITFQCVGNIIEKEAPFSLSDKKLNQTLVAKYDNVLQKWVGASFNPSSGSGGKGIAPKKPLPRSYSKRKKTNLVKYDGLSKKGLETEAIALTTYLPYADWRLHMVRGDDKTFYFATGTEIRTDLNIKGSSPPGASAYVDPTNYPALIQTQKYFQSNQYVGDAMTRLGDRLLFAYPTDVSTSLTSKHGYRLFNFQPNAAAPWKQLRPVMSVVPNNPDAMIAFLTFVNAGNAVLAYWADVNTGGNTVQMRGRFILPGSLCTEDFDIGNKFDYTASQIFYGDYHTAGGYAVKSKGKPAVDVAYPIWMASDARIHFERVAYTENNKELSSCAIDE